ncbi:hypothetical protein [Rothia nasisuis]|uniref:hypothetical protein n=1 Tax=Rothia nasisuis TaxID=2109647 RepID=UPI001F31954F|nr:hypothetical protein [Rothia nasisuis]
MIIVAIVSDNQRFTELITTSFQQLSDCLGQKNHDTNNTQTTLSVEKIVISRASRFINQVMQGRPIKIKVVSVASLNALQERFEAFNDSDQVILTIIHESAIKQKTNLAIDSHLNELHEFRATASESITFGTNTGSVRLYYSDTNEGFLPYTLREYDCFQIPDNPSVLSAQVIAAFTEQFQFQSNNNSQTRARPGTALATYLETVMDCVAPNGWDFRYYTGSVVSSLINVLEETVEQRGQYAYRGPNEHSLAAGALARWLLNGTPSIIIVTSAMLDEFRGTLSNLKESGFKGIIVCAEGRDSAWFEFQSTINADEDIRDVLRARHLPFLYFQDPCEIPNKLPEIIAHLHTQGGPYVLLATQEVLEASEPIIKTPSKKQNFSISHDDTLPDWGKLIQIARIFNSENQDIIIQAGPLNEKERTLLYELAELSGAALSDSLIHPGSVSEYSNGKRIPNYIGTLGLYGFNTAIHRFTHSNGKPRSKKELTYIFLNSRIAEIDTPFSEGVLRRRLGIIQVTNNSSHISPSADISLTSTVQIFIESLLPLINVDSQIKKQRIAHIDLCSSPTTAIGDILPSSPMTANYFFSHLKKTISTLIEQEGYTYIGVYDVGRCGISAIRNIPRTGRGFSGWFGRAIMGDAYQSIPAIALSDENNIIGFIGDGAAAIGPDIVPSISEHMDRRNSRFVSNTTVFIFENGGHSIINSYQEGRVGTYGGRQMRLFNLKQMPGITQIGNLTVRRSYLTEYDETLIRNALLESDTFDIIHVRLAHTQTEEMALVLSTKQVGKVKSYLTLVYQWHG